jgi:hypothetical protein
MQAQRGLGELRLLDFLTSALYGGTLASRTRPPLPPGTSVVLIFTRGLTRPQGHGLVGRKYVTEKSVTRPGFVPGTIRLVAQRLNHYATPGPNVSFYTQDNQR